MIDYFVRFKYMIENTEIIDDAVITIEVVNYIDDQDLLEEIILENLKEEVEFEFDARDIEIIEFEEVIQNTNLYRFVDEDVYFDNTNSISE